MSYSKINFVDGENKYDIKTQSNVLIETDIKLVYKGTTGTAISSTNLNHIESGIEDAFITMDALNLKTINYKRKLRMGLR